MPKITPASVACNDNVHEFVSGDDGVGSKAFDRPKSNTLTPTRKGHCGDPLLIDPR